MQHTDTILEDMTRDDPFWARAVALEQAARIGVPVEALRPLRSKGDGAELEVSDWMRLAFDARERWAAVAT